MTGWFIAIGVPWWAALTFVLMASLTFLGITRILCESGLAATRAQLITPTVVRSLFGTQVLGAPGTIGVLSFGQVWMSDVRTFVMAAAANGLKLTESIRNKGLGPRQHDTGRGPESGPYRCGRPCTTPTRAVPTTPILGFFSTVPATPLTLRPVICAIRPGPDYSGLGLMALGGAVMTALYWIRSHLLTFPIHPIGFAVSQMMLTRHIWFSVFWCGCSRLC